MSGVTYRIERTAPHCYTVVRLLDDTEVGTFCTHPTLRMHPRLIGDAAMRDVVRAAMRSARTSAVMHLAPTLPPENNRESLAGSASAAATSPGTPSSLPPPERAVAEG